MIVNINELCLHTRLIVLSLAQQTKKRVKNVLDRILFLNESVDHRRRFTETVGVVILYGSVGGGVGGLPGRFCKN